ncbi:Replication initiator protein A (RepA) N-terminus [Pseudobutyrivibrio sp. YE44]|uniref:replication initiator protein A n=1 Tax=Pseudobutyrivibrio sp. YE44 TaxID=1520802 RepID=UPI000890F83C|nr:replication initiator protein A [Pseudobutyrivibrio sp. YE44]SDB06688.1 Replication initiator protein A (RepA) N-terminus [Pseudobutyrivibrio sp. YE44]
MSKKYFYGRRQADLFSFVRLPKLLFSEERYDKLSVEAKVLYGFLLDRMSLSAVNGWLDDEGRVFVYYTIEEVQKDFKCGNKKACSFLQELEDFELIEKRRQGLNKPNLIYVLDFSEEVSSGHFRKCPNDTSGNVVRKIQEMSGEHTNNTKFNKTDISNTESSLVLSRSEGLKDEGRQDGTGLDNTYSAIRSYVANQISLDALKVDYPDNPLVDDLYELIVDVVSSNRKDIVIIGETKPMSVVKSQFMKLNMFNIAFVLDRLEDSKPDIKNIKQYLLAALYNSIFTTDSYNTTRCNHNMYKAYEGGFKNE